MHCSLLFLFPISLLTKDKQSDKIQLFMSKQGSQDFISVKDIFWHK